MGCNSTKVLPASDISEPEDNAGNTRHKPRQNGHVKHKKAKTDKNANKIVEPKDVPKAVSFNVDIAGGNTESLIRKHPPRLQSRLSLDNIQKPMVTADILAEKMKLAGEKRNQQLNKKRRASAKTSKRRQELMRAKEFEKQQQEDEIDKKEQQANALRESKLNDIRDKQKLRKARAERAKLRAKRLEGDTELDIDVEKDEHYNEDVDSWLNGKSNADSDEERIYSGFSSPQKGLKKRNKPPPKSASTVDSCDDAFMRFQSGQNGDVQAYDSDDFFDT